MSVEHSELSARVLSYLKRRSGRGKAPTEGETNAAAAALALLSAAFPAEANAPEAMFRKMIELARRKSPNNSGLSESMEARLAYLQRQIGIRNDMLLMMANIAKAQNEASRSIAANLR